MHIYCPTSKAVFLLGIKDDLGILRFPVQSQFAPGLLLQVKPGLPINDQLMDQAEAFLGEVTLRSAIDIYQQFSKSIELANGEKATLYVGVLKKLENFDASSWAPMAPILRGLSSRHNRLNYMLALQVFAGGFEQPDTLVFEGEEAEALIDDIG